ncbi:glycosyltransferase family 2 protein [Sphingosinicella sp. BN140058]|uniref:glycosyltransferase family 2 protein n=1 Tax=Sphingosinicella sp. BN140058 TaxID=1892855 RepID=UPI001010AA51|nr:glycosyltransferase family 2 protein [Sphingosinicella sp. BN140058]QAY77036.1 glycosyltransferase family 2 protein [Sphingosinicella sp. BN140058]
MFSVVIPLYNKGAFIGRTVRSALAQSFQEFELIIVDDGSTDDGPAQVASFQDRRLRVIRQPNAGKGAARNLGMQKASRPWIAFLDADDYWFPDHLAELETMARLHPEAGLLSTSYAEGADPAASQPHHGADIRPIDYLAEAARSVGIVWSSATAVRRDLANDLGGFGHWRTGEDLEYWMRVAMRAPVIKSDRVTAYYFRNENSEMAQVHRAEKTAPLTRGLFEIWPSVAFLESIKGDLVPDRCDAAERYQRSAAWLTMIGRLAVFDIDGARAIGRQMPGRRLDRAGMLSLVLALPGPVLRSALRLRMRLRGSRD